MNNSQKLEKVDIILNKLHKIAKDNVEKNVNIALSAVSAAASIEYSINQKYADTFLEDILLKIAGSQIKPFITYEPNDNNVVFYDGFGLDLRGLAITYTKAIAASGKHLIYVIPKGATKNIPHILKELKYYDVDIIELIGDEFTELIHNLNNVFLKFKPRFAFFYSLPNDVVGVTVFNAYKDKVTRYQIDLTDHAFWLGVNAVDCIIESRDMGASIAVNHRGFNANQIRRLDALTYINRDIDDNQLPFDLEKEKYIFSGGALYKTLGDKDLLYYKTIRIILSEFNDLKFLYAGSGNDTEIKKLKTDYPERVFLIEERCDFFRLIEHCEFYLNTYPMFGGMMMRYAALANKLPITLKHNNDSDGLLFNQDKLGIEFDKFEDFINEIRLILSDNNYKKKKEQQLVGSVLTEELFNYNVKKLLYHDNTDFIFDKIKNFDTSRFRSEYIDRLDYPDDIVKCMFNKKSIKLANYFPILFMRRLFMKLK